MRSSLLFKRYWQIGISLGLCGLLVWLLDWVEIRQLLARADIRWILIVFGLMQADRSLMAIKWNLLLRSAGLGVSQIVAIQAYYVGSLWSCFLPFAGGDVIRNLWLFQRIGSGAQIASSIVIERLYGFLALALVALASVLMGIVYVSFQFNSVLLVGMIGLLLISNFMATRLLFNDKVHALADQAITKLPFQKISSLLNKLRTSVLTFKNESRTLQLFLVLSIVENVFPIIILYMLGQAFAIDLPLVWAVIGMPIILAISRVPISMDGLGLTEGAYVFILSLAGLSVSEAVIIAVTGRILLIVSALPGIFFSNSIGSTLASEIGTGPQAMLLKRKED